MTYNARIIKIVKKLDLPKGEYAVFGSGLLDVYGLRNSKDVDIVVTKKLFEKLKNNPHWQLKHYADGGIGLTRGDVEMFYQYPSVSWLNQDKVKEFISRAEKIDGVNFVNFQDTIAWKSARGREKDLCDVGLIKAYLKEKSADKISSSNSEIAHLGENPAEEANKAIGVFDSGIGGLNVLREMIKILPNEEYIYYADRKNAPYGKKSIEEIKSLTNHAVSFLIKKGVKAIVIACNTATAAVINDLRNKYSIPIIGMEPAIKPALTGEKKVMIIATPATIKSEKLKKLMTELQVADGVDLVEMPKLVEFAENEDFNSNDVKKYIKETLRKYDLNNYSSLVLGCTHFSFFRQLLQTIFPKNIQIFDGSYGTAKRLKSVLSEKRILGSNSLRITYYCFGELLKNNLEINKLNKICGVIDDVSKVEIL